MKIEETINKTIKSVDTSCVNMWTITFTDDTTISIWAECGFEPYAIPYLYTDKDDFLEGE